MKYSIPSAAIIAALGLSACDREPATNTVAVPAPTGLQGATGAQTEQGDTGQGVQGKRGDDDCAPVQHPARELVTPWGMIRVRAIMRPQPLPSPGPLSVRKL